MRAIQQLWHRVTNRHISILRDDLGMMRICLRRFGKIGCKDAVTYSTPSNPSEQVVSMGQALALLAATTPDQVGQLLSYYGLSATGRRV